MSWLKLATSPQERLAGEIETEKRRNAARIEHRNRLDELIRAYELRIANLEARLAAFGE